ncbi:prepilin-type N-terminal cleavage/methylation domain-containing protein [Pseudomonas sp. SA3-5]|uniref:Prepilin-type N-terminal cleavage/methylation domain-containing protein n=1 Tax=Pseudomonas aestuarii TaxID=3018340 RepID=A0ABT4XFG7_9PSED|nr:prepilin-type N-terminal cleavage/methylation domain-containing protein [Pseudomonas aestuarii]MDA7086938.1 prepilin-type N-terminal cleavage/methylation domain-containing protein [Pseudomonas aestuarii]
MKPASRGFTLVELLVALTLASLVAMLAYGGLHVALRSWHAAELRQQQMELRYLTQDLLRRLLESPQAVSLRDDQGLQQMAFYGDEQQLIFTARLPALDDSEQLYWVQLVQEKQLIERELSWQLQMRYMPYLESEELNWSLLAETLASAGEYEVLVEAMPQAWRFGYLERSRDGTLEWQNQWQRRPELPVLLRLTPPPRQRHDAAELLVAPRNMAYAIVKSR